MDNGKDIQKKDAVARFIGNQTTRTSPFGDNVSADRAYRRAEKIVAAAYLLTNHLSDTEFLRSEVRRVATQLLSQVISLRDELRSMDSGRVRECNASIRYLISLLRMLAVAGHVSTQNAEIVTDALDDLGVFVQAAHRSVLSESIRLSRDEFMDVRMRVPNSVSTSDTEKDTRISRPTTHVPQQEQTSGQQRAVSVMDMPLGVRSASILEILRTGGVWGIKDIAAHLPEYSEKMIQRELADLVQKGVVEKSGAKRWSRYTVRMKTL
jgi:hypothetical protein